jgi:cob(I)alamin adenosyltransferase
MKIYTGTGDEGRTSLFSGERVAKHHRRVEAYGELDELGAALGVLAAALPPESPPELAAEIGRVQSDLFLLGTWLASNPRSAILERLDPLAGIENRWLEGAIDRMQADLPPLAAFILAGGHPAAAQAHVARCVCRRAERRLVAVLDAEAQAPPALRSDRDTPDRIGSATGDPPEPLVYLNRLSDYLFVLARQINHHAGVAERVWQKP